MARTAWYVLEGRGWLTEGSFGRPRFRPEGPYPTAFRPHANVLLHVAGLSLRESLGGRPVPSPDAVPERYFERFGFALTVLKSLTFVLSVPFFLALAGLVLPASWAAGATILYVMHPSVLLLVGGYHANLEAVVGPLLVVVVALLALDLSREPEGGALGAPGIALLAASAAVGALLRPHLLVVLAGLLLAHALLALGRSSGAGGRGWARRVRAGAITGVLVAVVHVPILVANHRHFGEVFLSTEVGLVLFQGHNPHARGSWNPRLFDGHPETFGPVFEAAPELATLDEKDEMDFYAGRAMEWIRDNPGTELRLLARKAALYFMPWGYLDRRIRPAIALVHLGFLGFLCWTLPRRALALRRLSADGGWQAATFLSLVVPLAMLALSLAFFVGYRWRFFAVPFFVILAVVFVRDAVGPRRAGAPGTFTGVRG